MPRDEIHDETYEKMSKNTLNAIVRKYLEVVVATEGADPDHRAKYEAALDAVEAKLDGELPVLRRLEAIQERRSLQQKLAGLIILDQQGDVTLNFIQHGAAYAEIHGIKRASWEEIGVPPHVLDQAGITK